MMMLFPKRNWRFWLPLALPLLVWVNIDSGPWNLRHPAGLLGWFHAGRAAVPFVVVPACLLILGRKPVRFKFNMGGAFNLLKVYGFVALGASALSPNPWYAFYWGFVFLATLYAIEAVVGVEQPEADLTRAILFTYAMVSLYAVGVVYVGRDIIASGHGYGIVGQIPEVGGMAMSRSSGVARFTGVAAIIAFAQFWTGDRWTRLLWLVPFAIFSFTVYAMQSRGAVFGYVAAMLFLLVLDRRKAGWVLVLAGVLVVLPLLFPDMIEAVMDYLQRGQSTEEFINMTGRTRAWENALGVFRESPVIGHGNWVDRILIGEHVHNAFLQALLNGGLLGFVPFVGSWLVAWVYVYRLWRQQERVPPRQRRVFYGSVAVLVFFFVRSIPETTTASFSVDLLVVVPVLAYLEVLYRRVAGPLRYSAYVTAGAAGPPPGRLCRMPGLAPMSRD